MSDELPNTAKSAPADRHTNGPFDVTEVPAIRPYVDFGSLKILPREGLAIRIDLEEATKRLVALSLDIAGSTLQLQAFSAPKSSGVWNATRSQIGQQLTDQGAQVEEHEGEFGLELLANVVSPETGLRKLRFIGVDGPRWFLRGVITGAAVSEPSAAATVEDVFRSVVVVRGDIPMPPRELLPLVVPAGADSA